MSSHAARRHVSLARALHARLYVNCEGRIFAAGGRIAHGKLANALALYERGPSVAEAPTPNELGVSACDGELSQDLLHAISRALIRWRKELSAELRLRPARRRAVKTLACEHQEIERLTSRLTAVRNWQAELAGGGEPAGAPFFLDSAAEASFQAALAEADRLHPLSPVTVWQARVVCWLSGDCATRRFLTAATDLLAADPKSLYPEHIIVVDHDLHRGRLIPAALAALAAGDGSSIALPQRSLRPAAEQENFARVLGTIGKLAEQIGQRGYDALLAALDQRPELSDRVELDQLRELLWQGNSVANCVWAHERGLLNCLPQSCLSIREARRLAEAFTQRGCPLTGDDLTSLVTRIQREEHLLAVRVWLRWLGSVSPAAITPRMQRVVQAAFWDRFLPSMRQPGWFEDLAPWLQTVRRPQHPEEYDPLLARIAAYQQFAERKSALPKSLRKLLEIPDRRKRERELLRARLANGALDTAARARLLRLEGENRTPPDSAKIRRSAEQVFLLLGVETLGAVTRRLAEARCREYLGVLAAQLAPDQVWDFAFWINAMSASERERLREVIAARDRHGGVYKRHLADNQPWIDQAFARGVDLDRWFAPESHAEVIGGRPMEISLTSDLRHIFLMGAYFNTCLSPGDCNQMSVLTNAYDANKQVVFMFTEDDAGQSRVVARQLLAVSSDFKLLGYCCYENARSERLNGEEIVTAMASYCGRLAAECGLDLADQGSPAEIRDHFWYDDGECEWPAAARTAWAENSRNPEALLCSPASC